MIIFEDELWHCNGIGRKTEKNKNSKGHCHYNILQCNWFVVDSWPEKSSDYKSNNVQKDAIESNFIYMYGACAVLVVVVIHMIDPLHWI